MSGYPLMPTGLAVRLTDAPVLTEQSANVNALGEVRHTARLPQKQYCWPA